jgi:aspartate carbamoyltransferase catalytic subunit
MATRALLRVSDLSLAEQDAVLDAAAWYLPRVEAGRVKWSHLRGVSTLLMFYEASTRTRVSFELAGKLLGSDTINVSAKGSSVEKGESIADTAETLAAMGFGIVVVRHGGADAVALFARHFTGAVLNAGAGRGAHPTQALLDALTLRRAGVLARGKRLAIVGDILHSRVMHSNLELLTARGLEVLLIAPPSLMPPAWREGPVMPGVRWEPDFDRALPGLDAVMMLRMQRERMEGGLLPGLEEYAALYGLNAPRLKRLPPAAVVLHPGPVNRGVEVSEEVYLDPRCRINNQVTCGVAVRAALLCWAAGRPLIPEGSEA